MLSKYELDFFRMKPWEWYSPAEDKYIWETPPHLIYEGWFKMQGQQTVPTAKLLALLELSK